MKISADLQKKLDRLDELDNAYYNKGEELVDDSAYDLFKDSVLRQLPPDHPRISKVGHKPVSRWPKEGHVIFMGSQNKKSTESSIREWIKKACIAVGAQNPKFVVQHKIDGFSLEARYSGGSLQKAVTRGNGVIGEEITPNVKLFRNMPMVLPISNDVVCRGEGVLMKKDFPLIQKKREESGEKPYKNCRNAAAGISRRYDGRYSNYLRFMAYDINAKVKTETEKVHVLQKLGFRTVNTYTCRSADEVIKVWKEIKDKKRPKYDWEIDGLVLKFDSIELQERAGVNNNRPEGQVALKFESDQAFTTVKDIRIQVGRTGVLTPVAILEPVDLMGSTIKKASLHNFDYITSNRIGIGAEVVIEKKGEIIPQVVDIVMEGDVYHKPEKCPCCGGSLRDDGVNLWCMGEECRERDVNRIVYWVQTLDMKGFSARFVEKLWDLGKIRKVSDLYKLEPDDFIAVDGLGDKTVKAFFNKLDETKVMYLEQFIKALGIPTCSTSTAAALVENFGDWDSITAKSSSDFSRMPKFAETSAKALYNGIHEIAPLASDLLKVIKIKKKKKGPLTGLSFCVTGSLKNMGRKEFQEFVVEQGGISKNSVTSGLHYLVNNDVDSLSGKNKKAKKYGTKIITEEEFFKIAGGVPKKEKKEPEQEKPKDSGPRIVSESLF